MPIVNQPDTPRIKQSKNIKKNAKIKNLPSKPLKKPVPSYPQTRSKKKHLPKKQTKANKKKVKKIKKLPSSFGTHFAILTIMPKNPLAFRSKLTESKLRKMLKHFALDVPANQCAVLCNVSRITVNRYYMELRKTLALNQRLPLFTSKNVELDESYFGSRYSRGKRGRGANNKSIVFGILNRGGKVFAGTVPKVDRSTLFPIINKLIPKKTTIHTDCFRTYRTLRREGYYHQTVNHSSNEWCTANASTNGIESFWGFCKRRLSKFCGIRKNCFSLHLAECEYRFNCRKRGWKPIYNDLVSILSSNPLFKAVKAIAEPITALTRISEPETPGEPIKPKPKSTLIQRVSRIIPNLFSRAFPLRV